jgi:hypothetical protein
LPELSAGVVCVTPAAVPGFVEFDGDWRGQTVISERCDQPSRQRLSQFAEPGR